MKLKTTSTFLAMAFAATALVSCSKDEGTNPATQETPETAQALSQPIPGQYIVVYRDGGKLQGDYSLNKEAVKSKTQKIMAANMIDGAEIVQVYSAALSGVTVRMNKDQVSQMRKSSDVAYIEQDRVITLAPPCGTPSNPCSDPGSGGGGGQEVPFGITRVNGGGAAYTGNGVAWIIDTGIDLDHPELNVDASRGFNAFTSGRDAKSLDDGNGHGSHVSGTIAAKDNTEGVIGVAPGATVIPVKVLDSRGSGSYSGVIAGVDYVAANGKSGDVANMSLGGPVSDALDQAVKDAAATGIKFALAAGNETDDANNHSPARANGPNIYTISAMDVNDNWASFSNYGNPPVDYCAPGVAIKSTWKDGGYNTISGTSMASPHAAGVLLLGNAGTDGAVNGDPDGNPDPIIVH